MVGIKEYLDVSHGLKGIKVADEFVYVRIITGEYKKGFGPVVFDVGSAKALGNEVSS